MSTEPIKIADAQQGKTIAKTAPAAAPAPSNAFANADSFALLQRIGNMFSNSMLVPKTYQGPDGLPDCVIAVNMANRMGADPLMVMQNLYVVHGRPAWSGQFVIAAINQSGRFAEPLHFEFVGERGTDDWGCYAVTVTKSGREIKGPTITIGMAKAEGWYGKNPKWKNIPEMMLRYRAGSWFGRTECPDLMMGFQTQEEVADGDILTIDPETGEVIEEKSTPITPAAAGGSTVNNVAPEEQSYEEFEKDLPIPEGAPEQEAQAAELAEKGYYTEEGENGPRYFNRNGDIWNPEIHATSSETGGPVMNQDGSFRARRGVAANPPKTENPPEVNTEQQDENPAPAGFGLD
jgi:hypothetical protein